MGLHAHREELPQTSSLGSLETGRKQMLTGYKGLGGLGDSYGTTGSVDGTSLPSSELLLSSDWGTSKAPTLAPAAKPAARLRSYAKPPASPMQIPGDEPVYGPGDPSAFPGPTKGGGIEMLFGIQLPTWLPKWAAIAVLCVGGAFAANYALRKLPGGTGGRRLATNPKGRKRSARARMVGGDDDDDTNDLVDKARKFRKDFHWGIPGKKITRRKIAKRPKVLTELGEMTEVTYKTHKRGEKARFFTHDFEGKKPRLAMDIENKRLHVVGGDYTVTADGITG